MPSMEGLLGHQSPFAGEVNPMRWKCTYTITLPDTLCVIYSSDDLWVSIYKVQLG